MKLVISVAIACALVMATVFIGLDQISSDPSTVELDRDIAAVSDQIMEAETDSDQYAGGAIKTLILARTEILKTTLAMLEQKRASVLRRIDLVYSVSGERAVPNPETIASIDSELEKAVGELDRFKSEAALYSGGLIQSLALMNAATTEMTIVQLKQRRLAEQYGFHFNFSGTEGAAPEPVSQNIVDDGEAL